MAVSRVKLCWSPARMDAEWYLGLFGFFTRNTLGRSRGVIISLRGLMLWSAAVGVVLYFTGALALWKWLDRRPYNYVTYTDLILPTHWKDIQKLRGRGFVEEGLADIKAGKVDVGFVKLRIGVSRIPGEIDGRLILAEIYLGMNASKHARATYDGGLLDRYPGREYIGTMLKVAMDSEDFEWALGTCDRALALVADDPALAGERQWLFHRKLSALIACGRPAEALALIDAAGGPSGADDREFLVLALLAAGRPSEAVEFLNEWDRQQNHRFNPQILRLQVRASREAGDMKAMDAAIESLIKYAPTDPKTQIYGVVQYLLAGRRTEAEARFERFLQWFGSVPQHVQSLAEPLSEIAELEMLKKLVDHAKRQGFPPDPFFQFLVQGAIAKRDWRVASSALEEVRTRGFWYDLMSAQVQAAIDPAGGAQTRLINLVGGRRFRLGIYKDFIRNMRETGRLSTARALVTFAQGVYPWNAEIDAWRTELDAELAAQEAAAVVVAPRPVARPEVVVPLPTQRKLARSDYTAELERLTAAGDYEAALQLIWNARIAKPEWFSSHEAELTRDEVRFSGRVGDMLRLHSSLRFFNNGDEARSAQILEIARELHAAGRKNEAVYVLKELLAKAPDYDVAQQQLTEWAPKSSSTEFGGDDDIR